MSTDSQTPAVTNNILSTSTNGQLTIQPKSQHQRSLNNNNNSTTNKSTSFCTNSNSPNLHRHPVTSKEANLDQTPGFEGEQVEEPSKCADFPLRSDHEKVSTYEFSSSLNGEGSNASIIEPGTWSVEIAPYCKSRNISAISNAGGDVLSSSSSESDAAAAVSEITSLTNYNAHKANQYQQQHCQNHNHRTAPSFCPSRVITTLSVVITLTAVIIVVIVMVLVVVIL